MQWRVLFILMTLLISSLSLTSLFFFDFTFIDCTLFIQSRIQLIFFSFIFSTNYSVLRSEEIETRQCFSFLLYFIFFCCCWCFFHLQNIVHLFRLNQCNGNAFVSIWFFFLFWNCFNDRNEHQNKWMVKWFKNFHTSILSVCVFFFYFLYCRIQ